MKRLTVIAASFLVAGTAHAGPNLVVNGSFEAGLAGIGSFDGWTTMLGDDATFVDSDGTTGSGYGQATDGLWSAFFGSTMANGGASISQVFATVAGQPYVMSFDLANDNGGGPANDAFSATVDGVALFTATDFGAGDYVHRSFAFVGSGAPTRLVFRGYNDNGYVELDRVAVSAVPEPATWSLVGGALVLGGLLGRKKRGR